MTSQCLALSDVPMSIVLKDQQGDVDLHHQLKGRSGDPDTGKLWVLLLLKFALQLCPKVYMVKA